VRVALGSDHAGFKLKELIKEELRAQEVAYADYGTFCESNIDYPDISFPVVQAVRNGEFPFGILVCGTGIGMAIAANKFPGIRAALCSDTYSARCAREHNDANILTLGARAIGPGPALDIVKAFLQTSFLSGRHRERLDKIALLERRALLEDHSRHPAARPGEAAE
jgi:ribose 5-phosphate isomerase B